jgi:hypothetical protein
VFAGFGYLRDVEVHQGPAVKERNTLVKLQYKTMHCALQYFPKIPI